MQECAPPTVWCLADGGEDGHFHQPKYNCKHRQTAGSSGNTFSIHYATVLTVLLVLKWKSTSDAQKVATTHQTSARIKQLIAIIAVSHGFQLLTLAF